MRHRSHHRASRGNSVPSSSSQRSSATLNLCLGISVAAGVGLLGWQLYRSLRRRVSASVPEGNNPYVPPGVVAVVERIQRSEHRNPFAEPATPGPQRPPVEFPAPVVLVDLASFRANITAMARVALRYGKKIRIGTKSIRVPELIEQAAEIVDREAQAHFRERLRERTLLGVKASSSSTDTFVRVDEIADTDTELGDGAGYAGATRDVVRGLLTFTAEETLFWAKRGSFRDITLAYPIGDAHSARVFMDAVLTNPPQKVQCNVVIDDVAQLLILADAALHAIAYEQYISTDGFDGALHAVTIHLWIDVDMAYRPLGESLHLGARRSPLRTPSDVLALLRGIEEVNQSCHKKLAVAKSKVGLKFVVSGMMGYEAQVAGVQDFPFGHSPSSSFIGRAVCTLMHLFKQKSMIDVACRRRECYAAIQSYFQANGGSASFLQCNGGGSGSLLATAMDPIVTEVTIGSGALCGHLFDRYRQVDASGERLEFLPALFVGLVVSRVASAPDALPMKGLSKWLRPPPSAIVVCSGGGWIASGPVGADRQPIVVHPSTGVEPLSSSEGYGEVQTPFSVRLDDVALTSKPLTIGDVVLLRPAKSGEVAEHFEEYLLVEHSGDSSRNITSATTTTTNKTAAAAGATITRAKTYRGCSLAVWS